ncbi:UvrD-helicase domain-containing protein [Yunchengibacter salinarum]|uniref:UvrD-helicase domain-containing protein n=1 Tax=Yunchengibacter salinarum TaxID=3133399 RepID=UPI0035B57AE4
MTDKLALTSNIALDDPVDEAIASYLSPKEPKSFFLFAGAGSGKTRSLVKALNFIRVNHGRELALHGHRVGVITYTNAACDEINRRIDFHPLFYVATIHSFAWELIKGFHHDIREWLRENLEAEIKQLREEEEKGHAGTKASITRRTKVESKSRRLDNLDSSQSFSYSPNGENSEPNALNHTEVIAICAAFLSRKPLMRWILIGRYPFLLIDESQDTNRHLIDALFVVEKEQSGHFSLGLIGDLMQRIYQDGKERIEDELPDSWGRPSKKLNHRCPRRIVQLINKIREAVDIHTQEPRSDAIQGQVKLFIRPTTTADRSATEDALRAQMAEYSEDDAWNNQARCKILTLEHHMSAKRLGFENVFSPFYAIDSWRTGLLDGSLPPLRFFIKAILPLVEAQRDGDRFAVSRLVRQSSPLLTPRALEEASDPSELLKQAKTGVEALMALWDEGEPTCGDILLCVAEHRLFEVPDSLQSAFAVIRGPVESSAEDEEADPLSERMSAILSFLKAPFYEIDIYRKYVAGLASFDTHQGVKGLEFERVMVILNDAEARGFMFGYGKLFGDKELSNTDLNNINKGKDSTVDRTRRLLYVTCSRAKRSLALVVYAENPEAVKAHVIKNSWFSEGEVDIA